MEARSPPASTDSNLFPNASASKASAASRAKARSRLARSRSSEESVRGVGVLDAHHLRRHSQPRLSGLALHLGQHPVALSDKLLELFAAHLVEVELGPVRTKEPLRAHLVAPMRAFGPRVGSLRASRPVSPPRTPGDTSHTSLAYPSRILNKRERLARNTSWQGIEGSGPSSASGSGFRPRFSFVIPFTLSSKLLHSAALWRSSSNSRPS